MSLESAPSTTPFVSFSRRYGLRSHIQAIGSDHFIARHSGTGYRLERDCERDERLRCVCPGGSRRKRCCGRMTQEDFLCDACREFCWGSDRDGVQVRLVTAFGSAAGQHDDALRGGAS